MATPKGRTLPLSLPRRFVCDLVHFARKVPSVPVERTVNVLTVRQLRDGLSPRPSWAAIFVKAYGLVSREHPVLRRAYMPWLWPHLYEHPVSVASVAVERRYRDEDAVFFVHLRHPDEQTLTSLDEHLQRFKTAPVEDIALFRRALQISRYPLPLRRLAWWLGLNTSGYKRAKRMGTFGLSVYSGLGASSLHPLSPVTTTLNYGVIRPDGTATVRLIYDHRVMDGATVARALGELEKVLNTQIVAELRVLGERKEASPAGGDRQVA